jgi:hypothetical protein
VQEAAPGPVGHVPPAVAAALSFAIARPKPEFAPVMKKVCRAMVNSFL